MEHIADEERGMRNIQKPTLGSKRHREQMEKLRLTKKIKTHGPKTGAE